MFIEVPLPAFTDPGFFFITISLRFTLTFSFLGNGTELKQNLDINIEY